MIVHLKNIDDERGSLLPIEFNTLPFEPKRLFIVNNVPLNEVRGGHSHYTTKQFIVCTKGIVKVLLDDGLFKNIYWLQPNQSILINEMVWDEQQFLTEDAEIIVLCSTNYDVTDYIMDYNQFLNEVGSVS
jgi:UDP-2-acetamido-3-amino-2,3-dideoxy-glucuronate N-acetyltransferase